MENLEKNYTINQLQKIDLFAATHNIKITDFQGNQTNFLGLNKNTIDLIIDFLTTLKELK